MRKQQKERREGMAGVLPCAGSGASSGLLLCIVLLFGLSIAVSAGKIGTGLLGWLVALAGGASVLVGVRLGIRRRGSARPLVVGFLTAVLCCLVLLLGSVLLFGGPEMSGESGQILGMILAGGILAGLAGGGKQKHRRNKK